MNTAASTVRHKTEITLYDFLLGMPGFCILSDDDLEMLERIMRVDDYRHGHSFKTDDNIYLVMDGEVAVTHREKSAHLHHDHMYVGDLFGLYSLIDTSKKSAHCTAVCTVRAASLPRTAFELLFRSSMPLSLHFQNIVENQLARHAAEAYIAKRQQAYLN